jgi:3-oxoacyl-[acyl-carrier-protein] synthase II
VTERHDVWITGVGLLTCLGEGLEATWNYFQRGEPPPYDAKSFAPYIVHPLPPVNFDKQIPKKSDQRQMEMWQRIGVYAAGLALSDAGLAGKPDLLDHTDMIVAAIGGERDIAADSAILTGARRAEKPETFLNERLMNDLRPTLFLAQLPNLLAGNISIVHGVVGSSRTFLGEESAGVDAIRIAHARVAANQSEVTLVGGASYGARWDHLLCFEFVGAPLKDKFASVWDRRPDGGIAYASLGAFLVLESAEHARARGARPHARIAAIRSDRNRRARGEIEATLRRQLETIAPEVNRASAAVLSGATGLEPATSAERHVLEDVGLPVRSTGTYIGHGLEAQFAANLGMGCMVLEHGALFPPLGSGDVGESPPSLSQLIVTSIGAWRGEGLALLERIN